MVRRTLSAALTVAETHRAILAVWRVEQPRLITSLARMLRDVPLAEDLTQEAVLAALERWPATGVPERPGAWLMATAKRRALDHLRRGPMLERTHETIARDMEEGQQAMPDWDSALDDDIGDELLRLVFTACHPRFRARRIWPTGPTPSRASRGLCTSPTSGFGETKLFCIRRIGVLVVTMAVASTSARA